MNCACYADEFFGDPKRNQICGTKWNDLIIPAPEGCCPEGCPGQTDGIEPRDPHGLGKMYNLRVFTRTILFLFFAAAVIIYLKMIVSIKI
jgi:hypothetical protein